MVTGTPIGRGGLADIHALLRSLHLQPLPSVQEPAFDHAALEASGELTRPWQEQLVGMTWAAAEQSLRTMMHSWQPLGPLL